MPILQIEASEYRPEEFGALCQDFIDQRLTPYLLPTVPRPFVYMLSPFTFRGAPSDHEIWQIPHERIVLLESFYPVHVVR